MHSAVRAFRANFVEGRFTSILISILILGMRLLMFNEKGIPTNTSGSTYSNNYLWHHLSYLFSNPLVSFAASTLSIFIIAWIISIMNNRFGLIRVRTNLPFIIPLILLSLYPYFLSMSGDYVAIIFILFAFFPLLESYQKSTSYLYSFKSSILIATASLFQIYALTLIPLLWRGEHTMRGPQPRSTVSSLFGLLLVYGSAFSIFFVKDDVTGFLLPLNTIMNVSLPLLPEFTLFEWIVAAFILLFFVLHMIFSINTYGRDKVLTLNFMQFAVFLIIFVLLLEVLYWAQTLFFLTLAIILISYLSSYFYSRTSSRNHIYLAYIMTILMLLIYLSHFFPLPTFLI